MCYIMKDLEVDQDNSGNTCTGLFIDIGYRHLEIDLFGKTQTCVTQVDPTALSAQIAI